MRSDGNHTGTGSLEIAWPSLPGTGFAAVRRGRLATPRPRATAEAEQPITFQRYGPSPDSQRANRAGISGDRFAWVTWPVPRAAFVGSTPLRAQSSWTAAISSRSARAPATCGAQRMYPGTQPRVRGVDQCRPRIRKGSHQLHDPIVRVIPTSTAGIHHGEALVLRHHAGRRGSIEHDRPCAAAAPRQWGDLGDESLRSPGAVSPPTVRTRAHHVVAVNEHRTLHWMDRAAMRPSSISGAAAFIGHLP